jgi:membrane-associated phospholipid phosphatase
MAILRNWLVALAATTAATLLCMAYVDRPAAEFFYLHVRESAIGDFIRTVFAPSLGVPVLAFLLIAWCALRRAMRAAVPGWMQTLLIYSWAIMLGVATERMLKHVFGRRIPREFIPDHDAYGFLWLHGHESTAFPSGTAIIGWSIATLLWLTAPKYRPIAIAFATLPCAAAIVIADHWVADVIAGAFIGTFLGWATLQLIGQPNSASESQVEGDNSAR